jgi:hypothetical protein
VRSEDIELAFMSPGSDRTDRSDIERQRQAAAVNHPLGEIGLASGEQTGGTSSGIKNSVGVRLPKLGWQENPRKFVSWWKVGMPLLEPPGNELVKMTSFSPTSVASCPTSNRDTDQATRCAALPKVPRSDINALNERATRHDPPFSIWSIVSGWVAELDSTQ